MPTPRRCKAKILRYPDEVNAEKILADEFPKFIRQMTGKFTKLAFLAFPAKFSFPFSDDFHHLTANFVIFFLELLRLKNIIVVQILKAAKKI